MLRYTFPKQKHCEVICEVVAIVGEQVIRLQDISYVILRELDRILTSVVYTSFSESKYSSTISKGKSVLPRGIISIGRPWCVAPGYVCCTPAPKKYSMPPKTRAV